MSNCSLNVRRTLASTAAKSTLFVTTPDGSQISPNVSIAASEMTPIGLILIPELKVANSKLCKESNFSQANGEAIDGVQQESATSLAPQVDKMTAVFKNLTLLTTSIRT